MAEVLGALLSSGPATLVLAAGLLVVLHKTGTLGMLIGKKDAPATVIAGSADNMRPVLEEMLKPLAEQIQELTQYANHETTEHLEENTKVLKEVGEGVRTLVQKHDNYEVIGIKTRGCTLAKQP